MLANETAEKALGLAWNHRLFTFKLNVESSKQEQTPKQRMTKRKILSQIARIFDPLGLLLRLMPKDVGNPILCIFSDASVEAFETCAYSRWPLGDGTFGVTLIYGSEVKSSTVKTAHYHATGIADSNVTRLGKTIEEES